MDWWFLIGVYLGGMVMSSATTYDLARDHVINTDFTDLVRVVLWPVELVSIICNFLWDIRYASWNRPNDRKDT